MAALAVGLAAPTPPIPLLPAGRRPPLVAGVLAAATLLVLLSVQGWAPQRLDRAPSQAISPASSVHTPRVDAETAAEVALHAPVPVPGRPGTLRVQAPDYTAGFDPVGLSFAPTGVSDPVRIDLASIERGDQAFVLDRHDWEASVHGASRAVHDGMREQVATRAGEVEWDVVLAARPSGRGDLVVRAGLTGLTGAPVQERVGGRPSWRLDAAGGQVRLGETVVKDAGGAVVHRSLPTIGPDGLTLRVPSSVLEAARYPLTVDPTLGTIQSVTPSGRYFNPSIAYDSAHDQYLVVYTLSVDSNTDVYGVRVSGDGVGFGSARLLSFRPELEVTPDVAWNGSSWLVVWEHYYSNNDQDIRGILVDNLGEPIGNEIPIATATASEQAPSVSAGGSSFLVTWRDYGTGEYEIRGRRINAWGGVVDGTKINVSNLSGQTDLDPDVAFNGSVWLVTWESQFRPEDSWVVAVRVIRTDGTVGSSNIVAYRNENPRDPAVASNGNRFLVVWEQPSTSGGGKDIWAAHVNPNQLSDYTSIPVSTASTDQTDPVVAYNGSYLVAWTDRRNPPDPDVYAARVSTDAAVLDPNGFAIIVTTADEDTPAVAPGPDGKWPVAWESGGTNATAIRMRIASK